MAPENMADVLRAPNRLCFYVHVFALFVTYFVHNVTATVSYDQKELLDIRTAVTHHRLAESFFSFNETDNPNVNDILLSREQAQIPVTCVKRRLRKEGRLPSENS